MQTLAKMVRSPNVMSHAQRLEKCLAMKGLKLLLLGYWKRPRSDVVVLCAYFQMEVCPLIKVQVVKILISTRNKCLWLDGEVRKVYL